MDELLNEGLDKSAAPVPPPACSTVGTRDIDLCVPVSIKPYARVSSPRVRCCGEPIFGTEQCGGIPNGTCDFNIVQHICVEIPIDFGAEVVTDEVRVDCGTIHSDACTNCQNKPEEDDG